MFRKLLSIILSFMLFHIGFVPPQLLHAQDDDFHIIAVLDLVANGISESEARSLTEYLRGQITRSVTSEEFKEKFGYDYKVVERS